MIKTSFKSKTSEKEKPDAGCKAVVDFPNLLASVYILEKTALGDISITRHATGTGVSRGHLWEDDLEEWRDLPRATALGE